MRGLKILTLAIAAAVTADGNGAAVDVRNFSGQGFISLSSAAGNAANVTLDVKLQHSADGVTGWEDAGVAFAQVTNAAASSQVVSVDVDHFHGFVRVVDDVAGTSPSVARSVVMVAKSDR